MEHLESVRHYYLKAVSSREFLPAAEHYWDVAKQFSLENLLIREYQNFHKSYNQAFIRNFPNVKNSLSVFPGNIDIFHLQSSLPKSWKFRDNNNDVPLPDNNVWNERIIECWKISNCALSFLIFRNRSDRPSIMHALIWQTKAITVHVNGISLNCMHPGRYSLYRFLCIICL